jgi:ArsR family transcriptional regulator, arsenate/arsenite/antimonite-responsive transcriptional repressor
MRGLSSMDTHQTIQDHLSFFSRAIGHPARVVILLEIAKRGRVMDGEQLEVGDLSPATVIQHLRELKRAGLIKGRIFGARCNYAIDKENLEKFMANSKAFFELVQSK